MVFTSVITLYFVKIKPQKTAIELIELSSKEYIIVETIYTTASNWAITGDQNGSYDIPIFVTLLGNEPRLIYDIQTGENKFVCYGKYLDDVVTLAGYTTKAFNVDEWDIIYPVDHNSLYSFILSKKILYEFELND